MSDPGPLLDRAAIQDAFRRLGDRLVRRGVVADIYVVGGAAMALAYDGRRSTRDIDAVFQPHGIVLEESRAVAAELGLPAWWLNEQASVYVAPLAGTQRPRTSSIIPESGSPRPRPSTAGDEGPRKPSPRLRSMRVGVPDEPVADRARLILEDLLEER
jgi:hypothetical protein